MMRGTHLSEMIPQMTTPQRIPNMYMLWLMVTR